MQSTYEQYHVRKVESLTPSIVAIRFAVRLRLDSYARAAVAQTVFVYNIMIDRKGIQYDIE